MASKILFNINSCNGALPDGTTPFREAMQTNHQWVFGTRIRTISNEMFKIAMLYRSLKIADLRLQLNLSTAYELMVLFVVFIQLTIRNMVSIQICRHDFIRMRNFVDDRNGVLSYLGLNSIANGSCVVLAWICPNLFYPYHSGIGHWNDFLGASEAPYKDSCVMTQLITWSYYTITAKQSKTKSRVYEDGYSVYSYRTILVSIVVSCPPEQNGRHFADDICKCIFLDEIYWFRLKFHWRLFPRVHLPIFPYWFRQWLGADHATSQYLNQCWSNSLTHICGTRGIWVNNHLIRKLAWVFYRAMRTICDQLLLIT